MKDSQKDHDLPSSSEIRDYFNILKEDPSSRVFAPLAEALIRRGRLNEAEKICQLGLEANPEFSDGHLAYARVLYYLFRYQEALKQVKLTLATTPDNVEAYLIAAEIFLARSQHKSASDACLKAIDLDPENIEARQILRRINVQADEQKGGQVAERPQRGPTSKFRATAGTAPSRRVQESNSHPTPADPFRQLLQETGSAGAGRLDRMEQPFSALSPGSYPADDREFGEAPSNELEDAVPTERLLDQREKQEVRVAMGLKKHRRDGTPVPQLPDHPSQPEDLLSEAPDTTDPKASESPAWVPPGSPASRPPPPDMLQEAAREDSDLPSVENIQALIDSYALRSQSEAYDSIPVKMPRSGRLVVVLFVLVSIGAMVGLILLGFGSKRDEAKAPPRTEDQAASASTAPVDQPDEPIPLPADMPEEPEVEQKTESVATTDEVKQEQPKDTETVEKAAVNKRVKPKRKKTTRKRRKKRKRRQRKRTGRKRKSR